MKTPSCSYLCLFLLCATLKAAEVKKWVDDNGQVHFGDYAPAGIDAETKDVDEPPPIGAQEGWEARPGEREMLRRHEARGRRLKEAKERSVKEYEGAQETDRDDKSRRSRCEYYQSRLEYYESKRRQGYTRKEKESIDRNLASYDMKVKIYCD